MEPYGVVPQRMTPLLSLAGHRFDRRLRARIGYMPQDSVLFPNLSVKENLSFVASLYGLPLRRGKLIDALERTQLREHRRKRARELSGGMQRRLALSAALVHRPEVLFLDEPTGGIDPVLRRELWDFFETLRGEGRTLFVTTQYVSEAAYCDRVGVLSEGRLVAEDTPQGLRRRALGGDVLELTPRQPVDHATIEQLRSLNGVRDVRHRGNGAGLRVVVDAADRRLPGIQEWASSQRLELRSLREDHVPFDDIFAALMQQRDAASRDGSTVAP
jgi:ABC-2 type transport system ATP-binding protein